MNAGRELRRANRSLVAKLLLASSGHGLQPVVWLYALNIVSVGANLVLQWQLGRRASAAPTTVVPAA